LPREYLFEFHYRDGSVVPEPCGEYAGAAAVEVGWVLVIGGLSWRVRDVLPEAGYDARIILDEQ
jgi:hypothetical protein